MKQHHQLQEVNLPRIVNTLMVIDSLRTGSCNYSSHSINGVVPGHSNVLRDTENLGDSVKPPYAHSIALIVAGDIMW